MCTPHVPGLPSIHYIAIYTQQRHLLLQEFNLVLIFFFPRNFHINQSMTVNIIVHHSAYSVLILNAQFLFFSISIQL